MKDPLFHTVKQFLEQHYQSGSPLLVGLSGGADSLTLMHLLLECRQWSPLDLCVAHVDHGWREESRREAELLQEMAREWKVDFYLHTLKMNAQKNLEEQGRLERLKFFSKVYHERGCQALLLAHHADDQAETVFKRVCEGASLFSLGGMRPVSLLNGMQVWRPLLNCSKEALERWLQERKMAYFNDPSNRDGRFLRARLRHEILPDLAGRFGKEVSANFSRLGDAAHEMREYLERKLKPRLDEIENGERTIDLTGVQERLEQKILVRRFLEKHGASISHESLETLLHLLEADTAHRTISVKGGTLEVSRGKISVQSCLKKSKIIDN